MQGCVIKASLFIWSYAENSNFFLVIPIWTEKLRFSYLIMSIIIIRCTNTWKANGKVCSADGVFTLALVVSLFRLGKKIPWVLRFGWIRPFVTKIQRFRLPWRSKLHLSDSNNYITLITAKKRRCEITLSNIRVIYQITFLILKKRYLSWEIENDNVLN